MAKDKPETIDELKAFVTEEFVKIERMVIKMASDVLDSLLALDDRINNALNTIEGDIADGLTSSEVATLTAASTATATRAETDAGITPPPPPPPGTSAAARRPLMTPRR